RARHGNPGPHPHQRVHRRCAAGARRGAGRADQPGGPSHRHLPRQRGRRPAHQQDRLRCSHHAHPHRHRGRVPGRPFAAPEQGQGAPGAGRAHPGQGTQRARSQGSGHAQGPDRQRRPQRPHPHLQLPAGTRHRPPHQPHALQAGVRDGGRSGRADRGAAPGAQGRAARGAGDEPGDERAM
ncbi:MAG: Peptide chain release factor 1, partial [uncultured Ramlibacter sp.]